VGNKTETGVGNKVETRQQQQQEYMLQTNRLDDKFKEINKKLYNIEEDAKKSPWKKILGK